MQVRELSGKGFVEAIYLITGNSATLHLPTMKFAVLAKGRPFGIPMEDLGDIFDM